MVARDGSRSLLSNRRYANLFSRSRDAMIRVYDEAGKVIETHEHAAIFASRRRLRRPVSFFRDLYDYNCL